jgi:hypothetical protein
MATKRRKNPPVLLLAKIYEAHYLMLTVMPNLTTKDNKIK